MSRSDPVSANDDRKCALFLSCDDYCCGRYCEELFNHLAASSDLRWRAASRALKSAQGAAWRYPMSPIAVDFLRRRRVRASHRADPPVEVSASDFRTSSIAVALDEIELKPIVDDAWPQYADGVRYWRGGVLREGIPNDVFELLAAHVVFLIQELANERHMHAA